MSVKVAVYPVSALLGALCAVAISGCGGDSALLRQADAAGLRSELQQVRSAVEARDCETAAIRLRALRARVGALPGGVDRELRVRLREEITGKLAPAVETECAQDKTETIETTTEPAPSVPTVPETTTSETTPPPETTDTTETVPPPPTDTAPTETTPPPTETVPPPDPGAGTGGVEPGAGE